MRRFSYKKYLFFGLVLFALLSLPTLMIQKTRGLIFRFLAPMASWMASDPPSEDVEKKRLEAENHLLRGEIGKLYALLEQSSQLQSLQKSLQIYKSNPLRYQESCFLVGLFVQSVQAKVIYRDPTHWTSSLWINVGRKTNEMLSMPVIAKNSPVLFGRALVGVIDYVGEKQSRVRLITDSGVNPSVRAVRGYPQNVVLLEHLEAVERSLLGRNDLLFSSDEKNDLLKKLSKIKGILMQNQESWHLAKGILKGTSQPLWRNQGNCLKGIGFNYDFSDVEGPARDLRSGKSLNLQAEDSFCPLLKINDLLVTTGMDGIFPAGLPVAEITKIHVLKEGGYTYEIEARPIVFNMDELNFLCIIPPIGYNENDFPR